MLGFLVQDEEKVLEIELKSLNFMESLHPTGALDKPLPAERRLWDNSSR